ncbi:transmembrane 9 superfamily member 4 [Salpingoeca rosetta]|uniref:Transmembrane 9 superfamily member n=1 Tax=Salpingoeca rosetta (strain ATCC 50818 / BSB-021) TaxID=946362 RepID=F2TXR0_SALR5|nr:transmembrane 9 superfamily member 4 [Salpingoeca rosetta]EGD76169.1 transmembrane 9 superfamily member 4 [Salpingoeca rosetta]|eukprot:XP_004998344.1 transmembrane 9 superfamily member 4 [Salpingoeca rosetta]
MGPAKALAIVAVLLCMLASASVAFYVPGVAPQDFADGDTVEIKSVKMTSSKRPKLPYPYYYLPFCRPLKMKNSRENLGEVLRGDRITNTPYELHMNQNVSCRLLCRGEKYVEKSYTKAQIHRFEKFIRGEYRVHWIMDNLPAATRVEYDDTVKYIRGYPVGFVDPTIGTHIFNHVTIVGKIHPGSHEGTHRIVGFEVRARSVDVSRYEGNPSDPNDMSCKVKPVTTEHGGLVLDSASMTDDRKKPIVWSYSVQWEPSDIAWASRWDTYLSADDPEIHWFSIVNSLVTVIFLSGILAFIMVRTLRRDIAKYNEEDKEEALEQTGWKLVHGDVFRPPKRAFWLSVIYGTGVQLLCMVALSICLAMLGMLSPASRGSLTTAAILLFVFFGVIGGYYGARLYKTLKGQNWKRAAFTTATFLPTVVFGVCFVLNFFIWGEKSSGAVPFTTMIALVLLWFGISVPLVFVGYFFGFRKKAYEHPVTTNQIPRQVPDQVWYMHPAVSMLLAGILPFGAVFIELFFILNALWDNQYYYLFGFLFLVFIILIMSCAEIAIVMTYLQLCAEDYHWWWRSFVVSGGSAIYVFLYSIFYFSTKLDVDDGVSTLLYFGYTGLMVFTFWILTGTVGFIATYWFTKKIYGSIKID